MPTGIRATNERLRRLGRLTHLEGLSILDASDDDVDICYLSGPWQEIRTPA